MATDNARGPLAGLRVLEFEAIGPAPFCGMMLADMGADVLLADRTEDPRLGFGRERWYDIMLRGRRSVTLDLKTDAGAASARLLASRADVVIEGFRPGVMERLRARTGDAAGAQSCKQKALSPAKTPRSSPLSPRWKKSSQRADSN